MLSEILVLALISSNLVLIESQLFFLVSEDIEDDVNEGRPNPDREYEFEEETSTQYWNKEDDRWNYNDMPQFEPNPNITFDDTLPEVVEPQHSKGEPSRGYDASFWLVLLFIIIGAISIGIFWTYIVYDLTKDRRTKSESLEQKTSDSDRMGMDQSRAESGANQTVKSGNTKRSVESNKSVRSTIGGQSANTGLKSSEKAGPKDVKPAPKVSKPKLTSKVEPSKKTLTSV